MLSEVKFIWWLFTQMVKHSLKADFAGAFDAWCWICFHVVTPHKKVK